MGYAFALALSKFYFPLVPTGAYVHYPTISTDMLSSLSAVSEEGEGQTQGLNAGAGQGLKGNLKRWYWVLFAKLYSWVGSFVDVVMTNSTWTQNHIQQLWGPRPKKVRCVDSLILSYQLSRQGAPTEHARYPIEVVFPPVAVEELEEQIEVSEATEKERGPYLLYIAQFRPEKNHQLILHAFAELVQSWPKNSEKEVPKLVLIGSVRNPEDATRVYRLRLLAHELKIKESVEFICDATWPQILDWLRRASVGVNGMWNEHFGIGVVEYQAAGLISVVNDSGGPKLDIVVEMPDGATGVWFHGAGKRLFANSGINRVPCHDGDAVCAGVQGGARSIDAGESGDASAGAGERRAVHGVGVCSQMAGADAKASGAAAHLARRQLRRQTMWDEWSCGEAGAIIPQRMDGCKDWNEKRMHGGGLARL